MPHAFLISSEILMFERFGLSSTLGAAAAVGAGAGAAGGGAGGGSAAGGGLEPQAAMKTTDMNGTTALIVMASSETRSLGDSPSTRLQAGGRHPPDIGPRGSGP